MIGLSIVVVHGLPLLWSQGCKAHGLSNCGAWILSLWRTWALVVARRLSCPVACMTLISWPGIEPLSPALEDEFLSIGSPGKSGIRYILKVIYKYSIHVELQTSPFFKYIVFCFFFKFFCCHEFSEILLFEYSIYLELTGD